VVSGAFAAAGLLAGCGSGRDVFVASSTGGPGDALRVVQAAGASSRAVPTGKFDVDVKVFGVDVTGHGTFDNANHRVQVAVDGPGGVSVTVVIDGSNTYVKVPFGSITGKPWVEVPLKQLGATSFTGIDGTAVLDLLGEVGSVKPVGTEQQAGVSTVHEKATIDLSTALSHLPSEAKSRLAALGIGSAATAMGSVTADVWIDQQGLVRRFDAALGSAGTVSTQFHDFGAAANITVPTASQVVHLPGS
jgi:hypothetical protein